jgi:hypothetical protein
MEIRMKEMLEIYGKYSMGGVAHQNILTYFLILMIKK